MSATVRETKTLATLDLSIRTLKPRSLTAETTDSREQSPRVVVVTSI